MMSKKFYPSDLEDLTHATLFIAGRYVRLCIKRIDNYYASYAKCPCGNAQYHLGGSTTKSNFFSLSFLSTCHAFFYLDRTPIVSCTSCLKDYCYKDSHVDG